MRRKFRVMVNGSEYLVEIEEIGDAIEHIQALQKHEEIRPLESKSESAEPIREGAVLAPMPGKIMAVRVKEGDKVSKGDILVILEAMKMENEVISQKDGIVKEVRVKVGDSVDKGAVLMVIE